MGIRESHSLVSVVWAHQRTALTIRERSAGHRLPVSTRLLAPRRWIYMASAIWSTHVLTAATASSRVRSTNEPARAAAKSARQCSCATTTHGQVRSVRPSARASAARAAKIASAATRSSSNVGRPSVQTRSRSSKRSTTSRGRSLIDAGGSCGSVHAWSFCAIWNRKASVARVSGLGSPNPARDGGKTTSELSPAPPSSEATST